MDNANPSTSNSPKPYSDALLCETLRERTAAAKRDTTATELVIQGLHHILGDVLGVEGSVEVRLYQLEEEFFRLKSSINESTTNTNHETRLTRVES